MAKKKVEKEESAMGLEAIIEYGMDPMEATAYRLALHWLEMSRRIFPDYRHATLNRGDPRKSLVFKICYKLARETQGVLQEAEYPLYVRAQLEVLRFIAKKSGNPLIDPNCLVGERAWKRWRLWKKRYDAVPSTPEGQDGRGLAAGALKAIDGLEKTKEFLVKALGGGLEEERYRQALLNNNIFRWASLGKISPYYLAMSPIMSRIMSQRDLERLNFQPDVYRECVNGAVVEAFNRMFPGEAIDGWPGDGDRDVMS